MTQYLPEFLTLLFLEIILSLDNVIFIAILVEKLPKESRNKIQFFGVALGAVLRVLLLFTASFIFKMTKPVFSINSFIFTGHKILLILGGFFLIFKGLKELYSLIFDKVTSNENGINTKKVHSLNIINQIIFVDLILSIDSIITAVGLTDHMYVIVSTIIISLIFMFTATRFIGSFIYKNPNFKILALNFINLIGLYLIINGFDLKFPKELLYSILGFAFFNECLVTLHNKS